MATTGEGGRVETSPVGYRYRGRRSGATRLWYGYYWRRGPRPILETSPVGHRYRGRRKGATRAVVRLLLEEGIEADSRDEFGMTPLSRAADGGHEAVANLLRSCGARSL